MKHWAKIGLINPSDTEVKQAIHVQGTQWKRKIRMWKIHSEDIWTSRRCSCLIVNFEHIQFDDVEFSVLMGTCQFTSCIQELLAWKAKKQRKFVYDFCNGFINLTNIYLFKGNNRNTKTACKISSKLIIREPEQLQLMSLWCLY